MVLIAVRKVSRVTFNILCGVSQWLDRDPFLFVLSTSWFFISLPAQLLGHPVCVDPVQEHAGVQPDQREADPVLGQGPAGQTHDRPLPHGA